MALAAFAVLAGSGAVMAQQDAAIKPAPQIQTDKKAAEKDRIDPTTKGPKGETVYIGERGGKYYLSTNNRKVYLESNIDPNLKGPKGQPVYTGPKGGKYYLNDKGEKIFINPDKKADTPDTDKKGTIRKADSPADNK